jgi:hypothetical protein
VWSAVVSPQFEEVPVNVRKWLAAVAIAASSTLTAAEPDAGAKAPDPSLATFGTLRAMPEADAKAKAEGWLKGINKFDQTKFDGIWAAADQTATQKTLASIVLGKADAQKALDDARDITKDAPTGVPAVLKDEKDPFVKATLGAAYARALAGKKVYEEALDAVKDVSVDSVADPSAFLFFKAVAEHSVAGYKKARKVDAVASLVRLLDDVTDAPDRYKMVATLMFFDLQNWSKDEKDLGNIGKLMDSSGRRLDLARGGQTTQDIQKRILFRLDEKIKDLENQCNGNCSGNGGACPNGSPGAAKGLNPSRPAASSSLPNTGPANGRVDEKEMKKIAEVWGTLPEAERVKVAQKMVSDAPAKYKPYVEEYFKALQNSSK